MKKIIGITASPTGKAQNVLNTAYIRAFTTKETTPLIIPSLFENSNEIISEEETKTLKTHIDQIVETCDALVLSGGVDLSPVLLGEKITDAESFDQNRDVHEVELIKAFLAAKKPIIGICRGFQLLGKMFGLNYFQQDLSMTEEVHSGNRVDVSNRKEPMHGVHIFGDFKEFMIENGLKTEKMQTNSWHHQGFTLNPDGKRILNKDIEDYVTQKKEFKETIVIDKQTNKTKEGRTLNEFGPLEITMATNHVIEGFKHKELPIIAFQNHPEEYTNSLAIRYFITNYLA